MFSTKSQKNNFRYIKDLKTRPTSQELIVKDWLEINNIRNIFQKGFLLPFHRIVDFYIPKKKVIIEVDGLYHNTTTNLDNLKDLRWLKERGMTTVRILNSEVDNGTFHSKLRFLL